MVAKRLERRFFRIFHFSIVTAAQKTNHWKMFYAKFESNHRRKMIICFFFKSTTSSKNITMVKKEEKILQVEIKTKKELWYF